MSQKLLHQIAATVQLNFRHTCQPYQFRPEIHFLMKVSQVATINGKWPQKLNFLGHLRLADSLPLMVLPFCVGYGRSWIWTASQQFDTLWEV